MKAARGGLLYTDIAFIVGDSINTEISASVLQDIKLIIIAVAVFVIVAVALLSK